MSVHRAVVAVAVQDGEATIVIECADCEERTELTIPLIHLATVVNACAEAAHAFGITSVTEAIGISDATDEARPWSRKVH